MIPDAVRDLLRSRITNYEQLEALLLLHRHPDQVWTSDRVAQRLQMGVATAATALERLRAAGLLGILTDAPPAYRLAPADATLRAACDQLAQAWDGNRLAVIDVLTSEAMDRLRRSAMDTFADAFRLRRRGSDG